MPNGLWLTLTHFGTQRFSGRPFGKSQTDPLPGHEILRCAQDDSLGLAASASVAVRDARDDIVAAVALDLETQPVARAQALEPGRFLDVENARAAFRQELRDRPELQSDPASRRIDSDDATPRQRLVGWHDLVASRLRFVANLRFARERHLQRHCLSDGEERRSKHEQSNNIPTGHRSTLP